MTRVLVVNADDYGLTPGVDEGIRIAAARGIVTSVSVMSFRADRDGVRRLVDAAPHAGLGLHADFSPGAPPFRDQVERFEELVGRTPGHVDTHKHAHVRDDVLGLVASLGVPVRAQGGRMRARLRARGVRCTDHFTGGVSAAPWWTVARLLREIGRVPHGVTELMCHPGTGDAVPPPLWYGAQRAGELTALTSHAVRRRIEGRGIRLATFAALGSGAA
ncbi:MAG: Chitooligosaccharide deacetylase [Planctomycetes bacterium]|nr:Chitooligosaccharide deacetylase [Planctomycetota bacterium]